MGPWAAEGERTRAQTAARIAKASGTDLRVVSSPPPCEEEPDPDGRDRPDDDRDERQVQRRRRRDVRPPHRRAGGGEDGELDRERLRRPNGHGGPGRDHYGDGRPARTTGRLGPQAPPDPAPGRPRP